MINVVIIMIVVVSMIVIMIVPGAGYLACGAVRGDGRLVLVDDELGRRQAGAEYAVGADVIAGEREAAEGAREVVDPQAGVEKGAEGHIPRNPRKTIEVENL